jgi:class 3 adenylate cyclase
MKLSELLEEAGARTGQILGALRAQSVQNIIDSETAIFDTQPTVIPVDGIPDTKDIPIVDRHRWFKVPDVIACFVDMEGSTKLSASTHDKGTARAYSYFTSTAVRLFHHFEAAYIDIKGDGVFALFDADRAYTALAATISFKTFVANDFTPRLKNLTGVHVGGHFGIDQKTVLVRKLGLKMVNRTDRQNEVWAGKPVNMAAKLAGTSTDNRLWISDRYHRNLKDEKAVLSCGCDGSGRPTGKSQLWQREDLSTDNRFDFNTAYSLGSDWCAVHGKDFCASLVKLDGA